ncbi:glycosyl hydrolase [Streptomyces sp. NPDC052496]|uniref:alpha-amylase family glycosyl hydrolase n=1 Tax=Streptomyces sp. NPDC052496 TaxID=3154951 RepID=UPI00343FB5ED
MPPTTQAARTVRIDSAALLVKAAGLPDMPRDGGPHPFHGRPEPHGLYRSWRRPADEYGVVLIGEIWLPDAERFARYLRPAELHTAFTFDLMARPWDAAEPRASIDLTPAAHAPVGAPATWVLADHDVTRTVTRYGRSGDTGFAFGRKRFGIPTDLGLGTRRARAVALLTLALPGSVHLHQGEELGLSEVDVPRELIQDPCTPAPAAWPRAGAAAASRCPGAPTVTARAGCRARRTGRATRSNGRQPTRTRPPPPLPTEGNIMSTAPHTPRHTTPRGRAWRPALAALLGAGLLLSSGQTASAATVPGSTPGSGAAGGSTAPLPLRLSGEEAARAHDGDPASYAKGSAARWLRADLGATRRLDRVEIDLPGAAQQVRLQGSVDGRDFVDLSDTRARQGKVTLPVGGAPLRHLRIVGAHRVGELAVYGASSGDTTPPQAPRSLHLHGATLSWDHAPGAAGYDVYADGRLRTALPATATHWQDTTAPGGTARQTVYTVRARDAAGNQSPDSRTATRTVPAGTGSRNATFAVRHDKPRPRSPQAEATTGATMPYTTIEAESGTTGGGAQVVGPNRKIGDLAGEASGRKAVTLRQTGQYVEFTTPVATNTLVTRFSIPDAPGGGGTAAKLNVYVDGQKARPFELTSKYAWLYGPEAAPVNDPGAGPARHIYDEAHLDLGRTVPAGSRIRLQKDADNPSSYAIDFLDVEQAAAAPNPDPQAFVQPAGFGHQDVQNALDRARMDTTGRIKGVYLPPGDYQTSGKFQVYLKPVRVIGAGPWYTRFHAPAGQQNTDVGFRAADGADGSAFSGFAYFGNYTSRIDGPGKVFDFQHISGITIDNIWAEHMVCLYWGADTDRMTLKNNRIRNTFADGLNMTNGSSDNLVTNNEARATGDDSFALFSALDAGGGEQSGNVYENLTSKLTWRAAGLAVYGGQLNTFRNIRVADTLVYAGVTVSSLDFGLPMNGFGPGRTTFANLDIERAGGHFWNGQTFPGIWLYSASKPFRAIRVDGARITDPTYHGIMFQTNYVGQQPQNPVQDTELSNVTVSGAKKSGDEYSHKSGYGIWANEQGPGPAVGQATFRNLTLRDNAENIRNTTSTFTINVH